MLLPLLALLFALAVFTKIVLFICYPKSMSNYSKQMNTWITSNFMMSEAISVGAVVLVGMILSGLTSFTTLVATGWFWSCVYMAMLLPIHSSKNMEKLVTAMINESKTQIHFKMFLIIIGALAFATIIYIINPLWLF